MSKLPGAIVFNKQPGNNRMHFADAELSHKFQISSFFADLVLGRSHHNTSVNLNKGMCSDVKRSSTDVLNKQQISICYIAIPRLVWLQIR